ncbi:hypothetical protein JQN64_26915, partial [Escherichia coli]|nr:hypothetical protein [Escherichia coli]
MLVPLLLAALPALLLALLPALPSLPVPVDLPLDLLPLALLPDLLEALRLLPQLAQLTRPLSNTLALVLPVCLLFSLCKWDRALRLVFVRYHTSAWTTKAIAKMSLMSALPLCSSDVQSVR